ncbi:hypothetical protein NEDG_01100 [Nematocida displodere]|uniref:Protein ARV n=1 Tax=Nematocida displodere TaxID=1805483 RepID=A0A177EBT5_9MICR|nr:hypothetical protein NEDG_01100 [Nematocida displodere]
MSPKCTHCHKVVPALIACTNGFQRHSLCPHCKKVADEYILRATFLPVDLFLMNPKAFAHVVFNSTWSILLTGDRHRWQRHEMLLCALLVSINTLDRWSATLSSLPEELAVSFVSQVCEIAIFANVVSQKNTSISLLLRKITVLSTPCFLKVLVFFLFDRNATAGYFQLVNFITLLFLSQGLALVLALPPKKIFSRLVFSRILTEFLVHKKFHL